MFHAGGVIAQLRAAVLCFGIKPWKAPWPSGLQLVWGSADTGQHRAPVLNLAKLSGHHDMCHPSHDLFSLHISVPSCVKPAWEGYLQLIFSHKGKQLPWGCASIQPPSPPLLLHQILLKYPTLLVVLVELLGIVNLSIFTDFS